MISDFVPGGLVARLAPYAIAGAVGLAIGGYTAWQIQGLRLTAAEQEFVQYKQDQMDAVFERERVANKQREDAAHVYEIMRVKLDAEIKAGDVMRRCIAAGKCGVQQQPTCSGLRLPTASRVDEARADQLFTPGRTAEEVMPVVADCAQTTLMLNQLQADIEKQAGY